MPLLAERSRWAEETFPAPDPALLLCSPRNGVRVPRQTRRCLAKQAGSAAARGKGTSPSSSLGKVSCAICCLTSCCLDSLCSPSAGAHERFGRLYVLGGCCSLGLNLPSSARRGALSAAPGPSRSVMRDFHGSPLGQGKPNGSLCLFLLLLPCPAASRRTDVLSNRSLRSCSLIVSCRTKIAAWEGAEELKTFHSLVPPAQRRIHEAAGLLGVSCAAAVQFTAIML